MGELYSYLEAACAKFAGCVYFYDAGVLQHVHSQGIPMPVSVDFLNLCWSGAEGLDESCVRRRTESSFMVVHAGFCCNAEICFA